MSKSKTVVVAANVMQSMLDQSRAIDAIREQNEQSKKDLEVIRTKARTKRAAQKPVETKQSIVATSAPVLAIKFELTSARPVAGRKLFAFTQAVLELLDMYKGKHYPRATLAKIMGDTAVNYHTKRTGAFEVTEAGIGLNGSFGESFFGMRTDMKEYDLDDVKAYREVLTTGKPDGRLVKNAVFIKALA